MYIPTKTPIRRLLEKCDLPNDEFDCWRWIGSIKSDGYSQMWFRKIPTPGHRVSYFLFNGQIPEGFDIDHLCRNKLCINPNHLEAVSRKENVRRGNSILKNKKAYCPNRHLFTTDNSYLKKCGGRECVICRRARQKNRMERIYEHKKANA